MQCVDDIRVSIAPSCFHNGFAADFDAVVEFYDERFNIKFTKQEDLVAFLTAPGAFCVSAIRTAAQVLGEHWIAWRRCGRW